ncbi:aminotransferase class I/II-fold pyridoxal phosphate-dependent enzyme [Oscillospiraceae bacterium OttesenSCG-928-F05]|nr:aminotransferase class I/II-fold pyridoxal phosphate-dependent enzyme [Oscillospiraceae bacterium OttesenSCG-928-F05]
MRVFKNSIFLELGAEREKAAKNGREIIDLSVGTPDIPPAPHIVEALCAAAADPKNYTYALGDLPELREAAIAWYARRYGVSLERDELCSLHGSQDGLAHLPLVLLNPGDVALVPNPGYMIFLDGPPLASAELYKMPLLEERGFLPDLDAIPANILHRARMLTISYPMNPLGKFAEPGFFEKVVWFAKKYDIAVLHDNAYSELTYDGRVGGSFLQTPGAKEVGVEFNSLSKSYNMTGCRISFALGNRDIIEALSRLKANIDYGVFRPVQRAAIAALQGPQESLEMLRAVYQERRDALVESFAEAGMPVTPCEGSMFVWTRIPEGVGGSMAFCKTLIEQAGVVFVPGVAFGSLGEGYVRIALVRPAEELRLAAARVGEVLKYFGENR